jgi:transposase
MDAPLDLFGASREELVDLVLAQRDRIADLEQEVARQAAELAAQRAAIAHLTEQLGALLVDAAPERAGPTGEEPGGGGTTGVPGLKPTRPPARRAPRPRKRRAHGFARRRMVPAHRRVHALARCPRCGEPLRGGAVKRTREVIEVPLVPAVVTEHAYAERRCPCCGCRAVPAPGLAGMVRGRQRLGIGLVSLIATLREEARLPVARIQWYLRTVHGLRVSAGAVVAACAAAAAAAQPVVERTRAAIRASPVVHADETGWRENGRNGYAWTFSTAQHRYFVRGRRDKGVLEAALGDAFAGVLVSDFYGAYTSYEGRHQYCWAHLLRDAHELTAQHPTSPSVRGWARLVHDVYERACAFADPDPRARRRAQQGFERELLAVCRPYLDDEAAPQRALCRRIERHLAELFVFVADPGVPSTNNAAERSLRHLVTSRKISGGTRGAGGTRTKTALATLFGTWRAHGLNPLHECRRLLAAPQA